MIQVKGSDTLVNLVQILAEEYMGKNPGTAIAVLGGRMRSSSDTSWLIR